MKTVENMLCAIALAVGCACSPNLPPPAAPQEPELPQLVADHRGEEFYVTTIEGRARYFASETDVRNLYTGIFASIRVCRIHPDLSAECAEPTGEIEDVPFNYEPSALESIFPQE